MFVVCAVQDARVLQRMQPFMHRLSLEKRSPGFFDLVPTHVGWLPALCVPGLSVSLRIRRLIVFCTVHIAPSANGSVRMRVVFCPGPPMSGDDCSSSSEDEITKRILSDSIDTELLTNNLYKKSPADENNVKSECCRAHVRCASSIPLGRDTMNVAFRRVCAPCKFRLNNSCGRSRAAWRF